MDPLIFFEQCMHFMVHAYWLGTAAIKNTLELSVFYLYIWEFYVLYQVLLLSE